MSALAAQAPQSHAPLAWADVAEEPRVEPTASEIREAVARITASRAFAAARRAQGLLRYLVEEALAGRSDAIKEYTIAQDVFGRDEGFDPRIDTCVRTEAWRLRQRLSVYYASEGELEPVQIGFAPRSLAPIFARRAQPRVSHEPVRRALALRITREAELGEDGDRLCARLRDDIVRALQPLPKVAVHLGEAGGAGIDLVLTCTVGRLGDSTRVVASLVEPGSGRVHGIEAYARKVAPRDLSSTEAAGAVATMVAESLAGAAEALAIDLLDPADCMRYLDALMRGSFSERASRFVALRTVIRRQERLTLQDPDDRLARRRLVSAFGLFLSMTPTTTLNVLPRLTQVAAEVLALDPNLSDVWLTLGLARSYAYDRLGAEQAFHQAIAINPVDPAPYVLLALCHLQHSAVAEAIEAAEEAVSLDPLSALVASSYGLALSAARRFDEAAMVARRALDFDPNFTRLHLLLGECSMHSGRLDRAVDEFEAARRAMPSDATAHGLLGLAHARTGERGLAEDLLADLEHSTEMRIQAPSAAAMIHMGLGARDQAFNALEHAIRRRGTPGLFFASASFDPLRSDDRFSAIERAMGLGYASTRLNASA